MMFNKCRVPQLGKNNCVHWYRLGSDLLERISAEQDVGVLVDDRLAMNQPWWTRKPAVSWGALKGVWPADQGR